MCVLLFQVCARLYEYKDCKSVLKKDGWEMSQYQKLVKENSEQFDFSSGLSGISSRDISGSRRKKRGKKQSSKKSKKKDKDKDRHDDGAEGGVRIQEQQAPQVRVQKHRAVLEIIVMQF